MSVFPRVLSEEDVKRKLKINDFRHLSKNKVIEFASYLDKMEPDVAKKALEQVPEFALTAREAIVNMQKVIDKGLESNKDSVNNFYYFVNENAEALREELRKDNISGEDREKIIDSLLNLTKMVYDKDTENKKHISDQSKRVIGGIVGALGFVGLSLGITAAVGKPLLNKLTK